MLGTPAVMVGIAGTALLVAGFAPQALDEGRMLLQGNSAPVETGRADRLPVPVAQGPRATVSTVELIGVSQAVVVLRDRNGAVLFRSDPIANTTLIAKDADLPVITVKEEHASPVAQQPVSRTSPTAQPPLAPARPAPPVTRTEERTSPAIQPAGGSREGNERPVDRPRRSHPPGCEGVVSPLADRERSIAPGLCLASLEPLQHS